MTDKSSAARKTADGASPSTSTSHVEGDKPAAKSKSANEDKPAAKPTTPPVQVPLGSRTSTGFSKRTRTLQVMLTDLGYYRGRIDGFYTTAVRNAVSELQQALPGYTGRPDGAFNDATRTALLESDIPTTT